MAELHSGPYFSPDPCPDPDLALCPCLLCDSPATMTNLVSMTHHRLAERDCTRDTAACDRRTYGTEGKTHKDGKREEMVGLQK